MRVILSALLILYNLFHVCAQKDLYLYNARKDKHHLFVRGTSFHYRLQGDARDRKGFYKEIITDSTIRISLNMENVADIAMVRRLTPVHQVSRIVGAPLVVCGPGSLIVAYGLYQQQRINRDQQESIIVAGAISLVAGITPFIIKKKKYYLGDKFRLVIR